MPVKPRGLLAWRRWKRCRRRHPLQNVALHILPTTLVSLEGVSLCSLPWNQCEPIAQPSSAYLHVWSGVLPAHGVQEGGGEA